MNQRLIQEFFNEGIALNPGCPYELRSALTRNPEKIAGLIHKITEEIKRTDFELQKRGLMLTRIELKDMCYTYANIFVAQLVSAYKLREQSDLARLAEKAEADKVKDMEATLAGKPSGDFADIVIQDNSRGL